MEVSAEVVQSLHILGLPSDATAGDVRSAFRRLARIYHPDVAGKYYTYKFERIAKAYALLKDAPLTEISQARAAEITQQTPRSGKRGGPLAWFFGYRKKRLERDAKAERLRADAEDARKKVLLERELRVEAILRRGEALVRDFEERAAREAAGVGERGLALRLASDICQVRCLALSRLGEAANRTEIFGAVSDVLQRWDIDENTARLVPELPLTQENRRRLARDLADRAGVMPDALLSYLLQLRSPGAEDSALLETYLAKAGPGGVSLILRRWPGGAFISEPTLCDLISRDDESVLIATFSAMKRRSAPCPEAGRQRLNAHLSHPNPAVRVWAKVLLNTA